MKLIANLGSFSVMFKGDDNCRVVNIDIIDLSEYAKQNGYEFFHKDVTLGLGFPDASVDAVYTSHMLEHLDRDEGRKLIDEIYRVLKPGGYVRILVPSALLLCQQYVEGASLREIHGVHNVDAKNAPDEAAALFHLLLFNHKTIYDGNALTRILNNAGFEWAVAVGFGKSRLPESDLCMKYTKDIFPEISLIVEAVKPTKTMTLQDMERANLELVKAVQEMEHKDPLENVGTVETIGAPPVAELQAAQQMLSHAEDELFEEPKDILASRPDKFHKIALLSTPFLRTPPTAYGGLELIVAELGEELAKRGYDVHVFATENSSVKGCTMHSIGREIGSVDVDWAVAEENAFNKIKKELSGFDIVHGHNWFGYEYTLLKEYPDLNILHTHHGGLNWPPYAHHDWPEYLRNRNFNLIAISNWMKDVFAKQKFESKVAYNGIDINKYAFQKEKGDRLLFVGRLDDFKNPLHAIEVAQKLNMPIDLVGGDFVYNNVYLNTVKNKCDDSVVKLHLNASNDEKIQLMQSAKAILIPSMMGEPFNLVAIEAAACGTPVIAYSDGGLVETVKNGYSGYVVDKGNIDAMALAVQNVPYLTPTNCRKWAEGFSIEKMTNRYLELYENVWGGKSW